MYAQLHVTDGNADDCNGKSQIKNKAMYVNKRLGKNKY